MDLIRAVFLFLPLLVAEQQHLDWIERLLDFAQEPERGPTPPLDEQTCAIGRWIHGTGRLRHGRRAEFTAMAEAHTQIHGLALELVGRASAAGPLGPEDGLRGRLDASRDDFLEKLRALQFAVAQANAAD